MRLVHLRNRGAAGLLVALVVTACSGSSSTDVTGTVDGQPFHGLAGLMTDAMYPMTTTTPQTYSLSLAVATYSYLCPAWLAAASPDGDIPATGTTVTILITREQSPIEPGTYTIASASTNPLGAGTMSSNPGGATVQVGLVQYDDTCTPVDEESAMSGTIVVSSLESNSASGTLNLTFADGSIRGPFNAARCAGADGGAALPPASDAAVLLADGGLSGATGTGEVTVDANGCFVPAGG